MDLTSVFAEPLVELGRATPAFAGIYTPRSFHAAPKGGSVFFGHTPGAHLNAAFGVAQLGVAAAYAGAGGLCLLLPRSALSEEQTIELP